MKTRLIVGAMLFAGAAAWGQTPPPGGAMTGAGPMAACREDMQKFCADKMGPDRRACMEANKDKLSDACKKARADRAAGR